MILRFKFIDDLSFLEILNLIRQGLYSYNFKNQVALNIISHFFPPEKLETQTNVEKMSTWTHKNLMQLNTDKSKYVIFNFTNSYQFHTRLSLENNLLKQVSKNLYLV